MRPSLKTNNTTNHGKKKDLQFHTQKAEVGGSNSSRKKNPLRTNSGSTKSFPCELRVLSLSSCMSFLILKQIMRDSAQQLSLNTAKKRSKVSSRRAASKNKSGSLKKEKEEEIKTTSVSHLKIHSVVKDAQVFSASL